jgi:hypothetical protein
VAALSYVSLIQIQAMSSTARLPGKNAWDGCLVFLVTCLFPEGLVPSRVGNTDFANLSEEVSETQKIEGSSVTGIAG